MADNDYVFTYNNLVYATSGAIGSVTAMLVFYPLDTVRTVLQVEDKRESRNSFQMIRELVQEGGVKRLYRGLRPVLTTICIANFVYFYIYHCLKSALSAIYGSESGGMRDLITALIAGSANVLLTTPLWVVVTRMKFQGSTVRSSWHDAEKVKGQRYQGLLDGLMQVARLEGVASLWNGTLPSLLLVLNPGIQFMVYEVQKRHARNLFQATDLSGFVYFLMGAVAKTVATFATYPLQVIQSRFRYKAKHEVQTNAIVRAFRTLRNIFATQGVRGLFKGLEAKLLQTILTAALMFLCYEKISTFVFRLMAADPLSTSASHRR